MWRLVSLPMWRRSRMRFWMWRGFLYPYMRRISLRHTIAMFKTMSIVIIVIAIMMKPMYIYKSFIVVIARFDIHISSRLAICHCGLGSAGI
jgi:hypothetical protein